MNVYGTIPSLGDTNLQSLNTAGFGFSQTQITGYIPNSTLLWLPQGNQPGALAGCQNLLYPVEPWMLPLTGGYRGKQFSLSGAYQGQTTFSQDGGEFLGLSCDSGFVPIPDVFYCGFCIGAVAACESSDLNQMSDSDRAKLFIFQSAAESIPNVMLCTTPSITLNTTINVYLMYIGAGYGYMTTEYYRVSTNAIGIVFYNPRPTLDAIIPSFGRIEGCTQITAVGSGFLHAPNATVVLGAVLRIPYGNVVNDSAVTFLLPSANTTDVFQRYSFAVGEPVWVSFFANGHNTLEGKGGSNYSFVKNRCGGLSFCVPPYTDPEGCPTPLCPCHSQGVCLRGANDTDVYECSCQSGYNGTLCDECDLNRFGQSCAACACDLSHSTCSWGIKNDGACQCDPYFLGATCTTSKVALAVGIPVVFLTIVVIVFVLLRRRRWHSREEGVLLNAVGD
jgi:hypothetical protein